MLHEVIIAGFGGQGVMVMGQLLAYAGMLEGKGVSWYPAYGPEMRGGTANCTVVLTDGEVASPIVSHPTELVAMNTPSLLRFTPAVRAEGVIFYNSSLIKEAPAFTGRIFPVPVNDLAAELGDLRVANMVMLGAFLGWTNAVSQEAVIESLKKVLPPRRHHLIPLNEAALIKGEEVVKALLKEG